VNALIALLRGREDRKPTEPQGFRVEDRIGLASMMTPGR
jgi:hypothetical protein